MRFKASKSRGLLVFSIVAKAPRLIYPLCRVGPHDRKTYCSNAGGGRGFVRSAVAASPGGLDRTADCWNSLGRCWIRFVDDRSFSVGASFAVKAEARHLVTRGLYSRIRNPIYVFGSWVIVGGILLFGKPVWLLIFVVLIPLQIWRARKESAVLE